MENSILQHEKAAEFAEAFQRWCLRSKVDANSRLFASSLTITLINFSNSNSSCNCDGIVKGG